MEPGQLRGEFSSPSEGGHRPGCRSGLESNELIEGMLWEVKSVEFVSGLYAGGKERGGSEEKGRERVRRGH